MGGHEEGSEKSQVRRETHDREAGTRRSPGHGVDRVANLQPGYFFFHLENQAEKQSLFPRVVMETKGHNVYTAPRAERASPLTAGEGSQDFDTWTI